MRSDVIDVAALLFDFDGVLFETASAINTAWRQAAAGLGRSLSEQELFDHVHGRGAQETLQRLFPHLTDDERAELHAVVNEIEENTPSPLLPGVAEFLGCVSALGLPCGLVTGSWDARIDWLFRQSGLSDPFLFRITRENTTRGKPDPEPYARAIAQLADRGYVGCVAAFEDSSAGIESARGADCLCIGIQGQDETLGAALRMAGADMTIADFRNATVIKTRRGTFTLTLERASLAAGREVSV